MCKLGDKICSSILSNIENASIILQHATNFNRKQNSLGLIQANLFAFVLRREQSGAHTCVDPEGGGAGGPKPTPENHKNIGFLSNTVPDPLIHYKAAKHSMLGQQQHASETPLSCLPSLLSCQPRVTVTSCYVYNIKITLTCALHLS